MKFLEWDEYQKDSHNIFTKYKSLIEAVLPESKIEHIGASAIPGAVSKGDVDIYIGVDRRSFEPAIDGLLNLGFIIKEDTLRTESLIMFIPKQTTEDVAFQLVENGSEFEKFLTFRNLLNSDRRLLEEYNELKRSSTGLNEVDYRKKKSNFVESVLKKNRL